MEGSYTFVEAIEKGDGRVEAGEEIEVAVGRFGLNVPSARSN